MTPITIGLHAFALLYLIMVFHESGHYITAHAVGFENVKLKFKYLIPDHVECDVPDYPKSKDVLVAMSGLVCGLIPVVFGYALNIQIEWIVLMAVFAVVLSSQDILHMIKVLIRRDKNGVR